MRTFAAYCGAIVIILATLSGAVANDRPFIVVQSTTSTQNSGLLDVILPLFTARYGIDVRVVAVGTGQAIKNASNGDGDVLLVHSTAAEEKFVSEGYGVERRDVMYNDFVLVGPADDPAGVWDNPSIISALTRIAHEQSIFVSRGDDSGTHKAERQLWDTADIDVDSASGRWYRETGSGMGATLNTAIGMGGYTLTDRATWIAFGNTGNHEIVVEGDERLFNQYGVILVNPAKHPQTRAQAGQRFIDWLTGLDGQTAIASFTIGGQQLFYPNAGDRTDGRASPQ